MKNSSSIGEKPTPLRLGPVASHLQMSASELEWSTQHLIRNILEDWVIKKYKYPADHFKKLRQQRKSA